MYRKKIDFDITGKNLNIFFFELTRSEHQCDVHMKATSEDNEYSLDFYNVTDIKLRSDRNELVIEGFEIVDNSSRGWEKDRRYMINDFENETISFYCRDFNIINLS